MKQWHLFGGEYYYPGGGMNDYRGSFDTFEEAADAAKVRENPGAEYGEDWGEGPVYQWAHVAHTTPDGTMITYWVRGS